MAKPLLTVRDFRTELSDEVADAGELLRNYEFNISQGIIQRVSRFFDALALMDERGEAPPARGEGGKYADSARGGVMGFGHKRNVGNQEKSAHTVVWEQQVHPAVMAEKERIQKEAEEAATAAARKAEGQDVEIIALKEEFAAAAAEQDMKMAALEAKVAEKMQALAAPSLQLATLHLTHATPSAPSAPSTQSICAVSTPAPACILRRIWLLPRGGSRSGSVESRSLASPRGSWSPSLASAADA